MFGSEEPTYIGKSSAPVYQEPQNVWALAWRVINSRRLTTFIILVGVAHLNYLALTKNGDSSIKDFIIKSYYRMRMADTFLKSQDQVRPLDELLKENNIPFEDSYVYGSENDKVEELVGILERIEASRMRPSPASAPKKIKPKPRPKPKPKKKTVEVDDQINEHEYNELLERMKDWEEEIRQRPVRRK